jgi:hypothetical protein
VVLAQRAEGASKPLLPLNSFFVAPNVWTKFSICHLGVSYSEFLSYRAECYRIHNEATRRFFADFSNDPSHWEAILRERAARRAARRNLVDPFVTEGVVPKPEPVKEGVVRLPEYVYLIPDVSSGGPVVAKAELE